MIKFTRHKVAPKMTFTVTDPNGTAGKSYPMTKDIKQEFEDEVYLFAKTYPKKTKDHDTRIHYSDGYRQGALESSVVKKLEYELKIQIEIVSAISGFNTENIRLAKEALNELKILRGGGE